MQDTISWSEEEAVQTSDTVQSSSRAKGTVNATRAVDEPNLAVDNGDGARSNTKDSQAS